MIFPNKKKQCHIRNIFKQFNIITLEPFLHTSPNSITYLSLQNGNEMFSNGLAVFQPSCWYGGDSSGAVWLLSSEVRDKTLHLSVTAPLC